MKSHLPFLLTAMLSLPVLPWPNGLFAQGPGELDLSFDPGTGIDYGVVPSVSAMAIQDDGKILIGGTFTSYNGTPIRHLARLNTDGSLDTDFVIDPGASNSVRAIAIQGDGKILIGGYFTAYNGTPRNRIARLNADGSVDETFDPGTGTNEWVATIAVQPDGKIIIGGGFVYYNGTARQRIARLNADGSLDMAFAADAGAQETVLTSVLQADGKIVIGGQFAQYDGVARLRVARLNTDGSLDTSFDPGEGANSIVYATAVQPDGKILVGGAFNEYDGSARSKIVRLHPNGEIDPTFGIGEGASGTVWDIALQTDGRIVLGGSFNTYDALPRSKVVRINADGSLDATFDPGEGADLELHAVAIQPDGRIVIAGELTSYNGTARGGVARLYEEVVTGITSTAPSGFSLFPNPASCTVNIVLPDQAGRTHLVLRNALGQDVLRAMVPAGRTTLPLNGLRSGLYALQVGTGAAQWLAVE